MIGTRAYAVGPHEYGTGPPEYAIGPRECEIGPHEYAIGSREYASGSRGYGLGTHDYASEYVNREVKARYYRAAQQGIGQRRAAGASTWVVSALFIESDARIVTPASPSGPSSVSS